MITPPSASALDRWQQRFDPGPGFVGQLATSYHRNMIIIVIVDHGVWRKPSGTPSSRGRGIEIMRRLMAGVLIQHDRRGTRVFLSHLLPDEPVTLTATAGR